MGFFVQPSRERSIELGHDYVVPKSRLPSCFLSFVIFLTSVLDHLNDGRSPKSTTSDF